MFKPTKTEPQKRTRPSKHITEFYEALAVEEGAFKAAVETHFIDPIAKPRIKGGDAKNVRKAAVEEAFKALAIYTQLGFKDADRKLHDFQTVVAEKWREAKPLNPKYDVSKTSEEMARIKTLYDILMSKFMLLDFWEGVATDKTQPEYDGDITFWQQQELLNCKPELVRAVLELMLADAKNLLNKPWNRSYETTWGLKADKPTLTKDDINHIIKAEASVMFGAAISGKFELEYKGLKLDASAEARAGAHAEASAESTRTATSLEAKLKGEVEVGVRIKGEINLNILDALELKAEADAFAGAMANAEVEIHVGPGGAGFKASAEVFAGAKLTGTATGTFKIGGREICSGKATGSLTAGVGAKAGIDLQCSIFKEVKIGLEAGVTKGVGAEGSTEVSISPHNLKWGCANVVWELLNRNGFKNDGRVWLLPVDENTKMCIKARDILFDELANLYKENEQHFECLDAWRKIELKVTDAVKLNARLDSEAVSTKQL